MSADATTTPGTPDQVDARLATEFDDDLLAGLLAWQQAHAAQVLLDSWLDGGYTSARVATVVVDHVEAPAQKLIMKVSPPGSEGAREGDTHAQAVVSGPEKFVEQHLVEQAFPPTRTPEGGMIMFQDIAGGSVEAFRPLSSLYDNAELPAAASEIATSLLAEWSPDAGVERLAARECVVRQLGSRSQPGGAVERWAQTVGDGSEAPWLQFEPEVAPLPNPLVWLQGGGGFTDEEMLFLHGRAHGDLHLDNVMVQLIPELNVNTFRLIDLSNWEERAPLCRDLPHLLLATIGKHLSAMTVVQQKCLARRILDLLDGAMPGAGSLQNQGLEALSDALLQAGDGWSAGLNMLEDWHRQLLLGVVASALIQASVSVHPIENRWWFFELAAAALARFIGTDAPPIVDAEVAMVGPQAEQDADATAATERLDDLAAGFGGRKVTVLIVGEAGLAAPEVIARQPWDLVVEFDPTTDDSGAYTHRAETRDNRLVTYEQHATFGPRSTTWLAADGLEGSSRGPTGLRDWRRTCLPGIRRIFSRLARFSTRPVCICTAGTLGGKARATVETMLDSLSSRLDLVSLATEPVDELSDYEPESFRVDPVAVLGALQDRSSPVPGARERTVPGHEGPVALSGDVLAWHAEVGEVVHSRAAVAATTDRALRDGFYRGGKISWFELDLGADVGRRETARLVEQVRRDLAERGTYRISLHHYPGAGGTTVARRVAWEVHDDYPVMVAERLNDYALLASRVRELNRLTDQSQLVVVESTLEAVVDRAFSELRADSVPVVFLITERRADHASVAEGDRSFYVSGLTEAADRQEFARVFGERVPERHPALIRLANSRDPSLEPFLFGLTTYGEDYVGLEGYVSRSLEQATTAERDALKLIALVHRYSGLAIPDALLAGALEVPDDVWVDLRARMSPEVLALLIEEYTDEWRTSHQLIAHELLKQLLTPSTEGRPATDDWKMSLSRLSIGLIERAASEYQELLPDHVTAIIDQLFIVRDNRSVFAGDRQPFSELLGDIPALEGRIEVMRRLAEAIPSEPHYAGHLGRLLSYEARDHGLALEAIERALALDSEDDALGSEDDALFHMKGMILRNRMQTVMTNRERLPEPNLRDRVLEIVHDARAQFERAIELNDISEYGYVALAQLCAKAIEFGRRQANTDTYGQFLADPDAGYYRELLGVAEESLDRIKEIRGGDRPSQYEAGVEANLQAFYDDYTALLQGWRNLLDRADLAKPPIRRQLVRAYFTRTGAWRRTSNDDRARAMELLEANLADNPRDTRSLLDWLRLGRFRGVSLDRASELLSYSVTDPATATRDIVFYDCVISALLGLGGRDTALVEYRRKLDRSRERAAAFGNRRWMYEWYTSGSGLAQLVHHTDLQDWDRRAGGPDPALLSRLEGRVRVIRRPQSGDITFGPALNAFFTPGAANLLAGRDENRRVSFLLGFAYEGPQAWSVQLLD